MNPKKDMIIGAIACFVIFMFFVSLELVEIISDFSRDHEDWQLDKILASVPALAFVTAWFAVRRWMESARLNDRLETTVAQLGEAIEQRRAMEEQIGEAYKMAAMGELAGGLTRELNNVMQPIVTLSQMGVDQDASPAEMRDSMNRIQQAAERGTRILEGSLAHPAGGAAESHEIVPTQGLSEVIAQARRSLGQDVEIHARLSDGPGVIRANRDEFSAVVTSLLTNAAQAMGPSGDITVGLEACTLEAVDASAMGLDAGRYFRVTVADSGPGMTHDVKAQAFDPFFTTRRAAGAVGLGLAVAYDQVHGWGGRISVESSPGDGATFEVLVPRHASGN